MDGCDQYGRFVADGKFVVPGADGPVALEPVDPALDRVPPFVVVLVELWRPAAKRSALEAVADPVRRNRAQTCTSAGRPSALSELLFRFEDVFVVRHAYQFLCRPDSAGHVVQVSFHGALGMPRWWRLVEARARHRSRVVCSPSSHWGAVCPAGAGGRP